MPDEDRSPTDDEAGHPTNPAAGQHPDAGSRPTAPTGGPDPVPAWRKALWVLAVLYALYLIVSALVE